MSDPLFIALTTTEAKVWIKVSEIVIISQRKPIKTNLNLPDSYNEMTRITLDNSTTVEVVETPSEIFEKISHWLGN